VRIKRVYLASLMVFGAIAVPISAGMIAGSREIVHVLLGPAWESSIPVLRIVALAAPVTVLTHFGEVVCEAQAALRVKLVLRVAQIGVFGLLLFAVARFGLTGFASAFAASELLMHVAYVGVMRRQVGIDLHDVVRAYAPMGVFGAVTWAILALASWGLSSMGTNAIVSLTAMMVLGATVLATLVLRGFSGRIWHELVGWVERGRVLEGSRLGALISTVDRRFAAGGTHA
jgi:hypothetical protein